MSEKVKQYDEEGRVIRENRSAAKREREKVKDFAKELIKLPQKNYQFLTLSPDFLNALMEGKRLEGNALRRHLIFLTKLLLEEDLPLIQKQVANLNQRSQEANLQLENLINLLLDNEAEGLSLILKSNPNADIQLIRQYLRELKKFNKIPENEGKKSKHLQKLLKQLAISN